MQFQLLMAQPKGVGQVLLLQPQPDVTTLAESLPQSVQRFGWPDLHVHTSPEQ